MHNKRNRGLCVVLGLLWRQFYGHSWNKTMTNWWIKCFVDLNVWFFVKFEASFTQDAFHSSKPNDFECVFIDFFLLSLFNWKTVSSGFKRHTPIIFCPEKVNHLWIIWPSKIARNYFPLFNINKKTIHFLVMTLTLLARFCIPANHLYTFWQYFHGLWQHIFWW